MKLAFTERPAQSTGGERCFPLDWLRALVVLGLIPYHVAVVFAIGPGDYVKSPQRSLFFDVVATLASFWGMPLLFLVAGAATWYALGRRSPVRYLLERVKRLLIPFIFGVLALVPVQLYFERRSVPGYSLNYAQFYWAFLVDWAHILQHRVFGLGFQYWGHLWFIVYLMAMSFFLLPLLLLMRRPPTRAFLSGIATPGHGLLGIALLGAPLAIIEAALLGPIGPLPVADYFSLYNGPAGLVLYAAVFALGYLLFAEPRFLSATVTYRRWALAFGITLILLHEALVAFGGAPLVEAPWGALAIRVLRGYIAWFCVVAILGYALRYLTMNNRALRYLNEACYPVYVLHMPVLTALGFYLVRWNLPLPVAFLALLVATAGVTFALYEGLVRRIPLLRFLFGLTPRRRAASPGGHGPGIAATDLQAKGAAGVSALHTAGEYAQGR